MRILLLILVFSVILLSLPLNTFVKSEQEKFDQIFPVISPTGFLCLFDKRDGKIYIYDTDSLKCKFVLQLKDLGEPLEKIK